MTPGCDPEESCSVSVRPIENGFVCRESRCSGGNYTSREYFSSTKPPMPETYPSTGPGGEGLRGAMRELKRSK